jgi:hypothetical protein
MVVSVWVYSVQVKFSPFASVQVHLGHVWSGMFGFVQVRLGLFRSGLVRLGLLRSVWVCLCLVQVRLGSFRSVWVRSGLFGFVQVHLVSDPMTLKMRSMPPMHVHQCL